MRSFEQNLSFVGTDNLQSMSIMVDYLCRTGERPCFVEMPAVNANARERREGYVQAMRQLGREPAILAPTENDWNFEELGFRVAAQSIAAGGFPTRTVLCANDRLAIGVMAAACAHGLRVGIAPGSDLRVAGHDDHPLSKFTCPALTTVAQDYSGLALRSVEILMGMIETGKRTPNFDVQEERLEARLVMRASA